MRRPTTLALLLAVSFGLFACSSKEEREAKLALKEMTQGCVSSGTPEAVCTCAFEDESMIKSAIRLSENKSDREMRATFTSKLHAKMAHCVEEELGINPNTADTEDQLKLMEQLIPRK